MVDIDNVVSEFEMQSHSDVYFGIITLEKGIK